MKLKIHPEIQEAELKKLSKVAVAIEETIDSKLLEKFNDGHPLREINIDLTQKKWRESLECFLQRK